MGGKTGGGKTGGKGGGKPKVGVKYKADMNAALDTVGVILRRSCATELLNALIIALGVSPQYKKKKGKGKSKGKKDGGTPKGGSKPKGGGGTPKGGIKPKGGKKLKGGKLA